MQRQDLLVADVLPPRNHRFDTRKKSLAIVFGRDHDIKCAWLVVVVDQL